MEIEVSWRLQGKFLSGNGHWSRLHASMKIVVDQNLTVTYEPSSPECAEYSIQMCQLILRNARIAWDVVFVGFGEGGRSCLDLFSGDRRQR